MVKEQIDDAASNRKKRKITRGIICRRRGRSNPKVRQRTTGIKAGTRRKRTLEERGDARRAGER
jgi:hypothetical protein